MGQLVTPRAVMARQPGDWEGGMASNLGPKLLLPPLHPPPSPQSFQVQAKVGPQCGPHQLHPSPPPISQRHMQNPICGVGGKVDSSCPDKAAAVAPIPNVGLVLRRCSGKGLHLAMTGEPRGFSRVMAGFSSYDGEFRLPLVLAQASPIFHSSCEGKLGIALE